jgi:hypothetical protein
LRRALRLQTERMAAQVQQSAARRVVWAVEFGGIARERIVRVQLRGFR